MSAVRISTSLSQLRVRGYECDAVGHVNNAVYVQYLEQATLDALGLTPAELAWEPSAVSIAYHSPAYYGDELQVRTWRTQDRDAPLTPGHPTLGHPTPGHPTLAYRVTCPVDGRLVVEAEISWRRRDAGRDLTPFPGDLAPAAPGTEVLSLKPFTRPRDNGARPFHWRTTVRFHEVGTANRVSLVTYFYWLEAATLRACTRAGWPLERTRAEDFLVVQYRHDVELFAAATHDDEIEIVSRLIEVRSVRGTWLHEIRNAATAALLARDYSVGAFTDWTGRVRSVLPAMMDALVLGDPH